MGAQKMLVAGPAAARNRRGWLRPRPALVFSEWVTLRAKSPGLALPMRLSSRYERGTPRAGKVHGELRNNPPARRTNAGYLLGAESAFDPFGRAPRRCPASL